MDISSVPSLSAATATSEFAVKVSEGQEDQFEKVVMTILEGAVRVPEQGTGQSLNLVA